MKQKTYIHKEAVTKAAQKISFQIKLPLDVKTVKGVHLGCYVKRRPLDGGVYDIGGGPGGTPPVTPSAPPNPRLPVGVLKLQAPDSSNIFYVEELFLLNPTIAALDFSLGGVWTEQRYTHGTRHEAELLETCGSNTIINGFYKDELIAVLPSCLYEIVITINYEALEP